MIKIFKNIKNGIANLNLTSILKIIGNLFLALAIILTLTFTLVNLIKGVSKSIEKRIEKRTSQTEYVINSRGYKVYHSKVQLKYEELKSIVVDDITLYIDSVAPGNSLDAIVLVDSCEKYDVSIRFAMAQGMLESQFGTKGIARRTNSVWNVMSFDGRSAENIINRGHGYSHPDYSVGPYLRLLTNKYLVNNKTEEDLLIEFIDSNGNRYASAKDYEKKLQSIYIKLGKNDKLMHDILLYHKYMMLLH